MLRRLKLQSTASASCDYDQQASASEAECSPYSDRSASIVSKRKLKIPVLIAFQFIVNPCEAVEESSVGSAILHRK